MVKKAPFRRPPSIITTLYPDNDASLAKDLDVLYNVVAQALAVGTRAVSLTCTYCATHGLAYKIAPAIASASSAAPFYTEAAATPPALLHALIQTAVLDSGALEAGVQPASDESSQVFLRHEMIERIPVLLSWMSRPKGSESRNFAGAY